MKFSIRQYTLFSIILIVSLVSIFSVKTFSNFTTIQKDIETSRKTDAANELSHALEITIENIKQTGQYFSQWQEVRQQINNPEIFDYWYSVRFKKHAFDLQKYTKDLMIYDASGTALSKLDSVNLEHKINTQDISDITFRIDNESDLLYIIPIYISGKNENIIGYISSRLDFLPLLKSLGHLQHIEISSLSLRHDLQQKLLTSINSKHFTYKLIKSQSIKKLESALTRSITELVIFITIPSLLLLLFIIYMIGNPIRSITKYINELRLNQGSDIIPSRRSLQVHEINEILSALSDYHNELTEKEENLSSTLNSIGDAVITTNSDYRIIRMNPVAERLTGWSSEAASNHILSDVFNIINSDNRQVIHLDLASVAKDRYSRQKLNDVTLISKNNDEYVISESAAPIVTPDDHTIGLVIVFNDRTDQKIKDEQLQQSQKMDALGKLTGGIAHDFNNMVGIILGYSELLLLKYDKSTPLYNHIFQIHEAADRAKLLTSKLLKFSSKNTHQNLVCDVNELIVNEKHMLSKTLTARIKLDLQLANDIWPVDLEPSTFQDALLNVCINSMHAMPEGGTLTIQTKNLHFEEMDQVNSEQISGDYILVSISDTGVGMDKETRLKIFDPFFTTKGEKGTGLGMSQVYGFVQQTEGQIQINSEIGHGTRISIYLPRAKSDIKTNNSINNTKLSEQQGDETILIVDDEESLAKLCEDILSQAGYKTLLATSANSALDILQNENIDLLLSDIIMPDIDGFQLSDIVLEKFPNLKIQLMSGFSGESSVQNNNLQTNILSKPFTSSELLSKVRQLLDN